MSSFGRIDLPMQHARHCSRNLHQTAEREINVGIYTYALFSYGLTAVIALLTVGVIIITKKIINRFSGVGSND